MEFTIFSISGFDRGIEEDGGSWLDLRVIGAV